MGARPPVLLASVHAAPSWALGASVSSRFITDSKRGEASVSSTGASRPSVFNTQAVCGLSAPARAATAFAPSRSRSSQA